MLKKLFIGVVALGALLVFVAPARQQVGRAISWVQAEAEEAVPLNYQLEEAEKELSELDPEIFGARRVVAAEEVELEDLERDLARLDREHATDTARLRERTDVLRASAGNAALVVAGRTFSRERVAQEVAIAVERHERRSALIESKRQTYLARAKSVEAARTRLEGMVTERERMALAIEELRALWRENQALEMARGTHRFDDSKLSEVANRLESIRKKLKIQRRVIEQSDPVLGSIDRAEVDPTEVLRRAERRLSDCESDDHEELKPLR